MIVFDIKRYAINDGPGIRTTLFLKGCPLRCVWCHNPESWRPEPEWLFKAKKCIGCNTCGVYPNQLEWIKQAHTLPDREELAADLCPTLALEICGKDWTIEDLLAEIEKERDVMQDSGGGVTISGGEPLMQAKARPLSISPRWGEGSLSHKTTTSGNATLPPTGGDGEGLLLLVDLKVMDPEKHKRFTGVDNRRILENLHLLAGLGTPFQIRIPLIDGVNSDCENIEQTARFLESLNKASSTFSSQLKGVALLPYHEMGRDKHARRGTTYNPGNYPLGTPTDDTINRCIRQFARHGISASAGG